MPFEVVESKIIFENRRIMGRTSFVKIVKEIVFYF
jgi:hypothetical protein